LRLWCARASEAFLPDYVNHGDYLRACDDKSKSGTITSVLFPDEDVLRATEARLKQQYFLVSASLHDIIRRFKRTNSNLLELHKKVVIQLSSSNCALAVPELMRRLVDIENMPWDKAWEITSNVFAYTVHAVSREGLDSWPVYLMDEVLPRHMQITYEINQKHLDQVREKFGNNNDLVREISVIQEGEVKRLKLGHLATLGSYVVNGVSQSQAALLSKSLFPEFSTVYPLRFTSKTNGVSHRRWLLTANHSLSKAITAAIGPSWVGNPQDLVKLEQFSDDSSFADTLARLHRTAKQGLGVTIKKLTGIDVDPAAMYDVHCKKIHLYKRQVLNTLHILSRYLRIKAGETMPGKRVHIFAGKAAPSDHLAKQVIKLIHVAASIVNNDPDVKDAIKVVFLPDYGVSLAEKIIPAADLSEQIATPGQEASGTGNAKFTMNGALLMASKSGSNSEIISRIGQENAFVFGHEANELPIFNEYQPYDIILGNAKLNEVFKLLDEYMTKTQDTGISIRPLISTIMDSDRYFVLLDFNDYIQKQDSADLLFANQHAWIHKSIQCIARAGYFSIDRTVREYAQDIWKVS
jgi:starch phosphorylase